MKNSLLLMCLLVLSFTNSAEVIFSDKYGFTLEIKQQVNVDQSIAYQQFLRIDQWWNAEHTYFGDSSKLILQAKAGGCFCEINGKKQVLHMTVSYVEPNKEIRLLGGLGPLQMMAVQGAMSWQFKKLNNNSTMIIQRYHVTGAIKGGLDKLAPIVDKVQTGQLNKLVEKLKNN